MRSCTGSEYHRRAVIRSVATLCLLAGALCVLACGPDAERSSDASPDAASGPLNVLVVTLDTTRADALGAYGQSLPVSPRIDAMAADGVLFEQAVSSVPSTFPSHSTLFTGKQPYAHGVRSNGGYRLSEANLTLAEVLRTRGYRSHAEIAAPVLARKTQLDQGFDDYRDPKTSRAILELIDRQRGGWRGGAQRSAEEITRSGIEFLRESAGHPFLLWLHYFDPHVPQRAGALQEPGTGQRLPRRGAKGRSSRGPRARRARAARPAREHDRGADGRSRRRPGRARRGDPLLLRL